MLQKNLICYILLLGRAENFGFSFLVTNGWIVVGFLWWWGVVLLLVLFVCLFFKVRICAVCYRPSCTDFEGLHL